MKKGCEGCRGEDIEAQQKKLEEMMKKRVKPVNCPYKATCTQKVLEEEAELMCKDQERSQEAVMIHMNGRHVFELCQEYVRQRREREGRLPKDW